jgi:hypothetical protein
MVFAYLFTMYIAAVPLNFDSHNAPREQVIVNLNAGVDITTNRDGELRLNAGEAFFVDIA